MSKIIITALEACQPQLVDMSCSENTPPIGAYHVNFHRLEIVLKGQYQVILDSDPSIKNLTLYPNEMIYIPSNAWNKPLWHSNCDLLSILFSRTQIGFSLVQYDTNDGFINVIKHTIALPSSPIFEHIIEALHGLSHEKNALPIAEHLSQSLILYCLKILGDSAKKPQRRSEKLYRNISLYIQEHFHKDVTRTMIGKRFGISTAYISRLFHHEGNIKYADYVVNVRLDRAKFMLNTYNFKVSDIAKRCGFQDTNYFCRVFKQKTGKTPSQYRLDS